jgi:uncharacterized protein involved in exopolysaccharide biosynthesis
VEFPREIKPTVQEAHEEFLKLLTIDKDKSTGLVTLTIEHISPLEAKKWVEWLVADINENVRNHDVLQAEESIRLLKQQIAETQLAELQASFFELIQNQTKTLMLAKANPDYLFRVIDPPVISELKAGPRRAIIVLVFCILGGFLSLVYLVASFLLRYED